MRRWFCRATPLLFPALLASCGGAAAASLARAVTDTLPGGIPRVTSRGPTAWPDSAGARLVEEGRFSGDEGTPSELGNPQSIAVDGEGRVYVVDRKPATIKVFTADGKLVRSFGREGEGPGEFRIGFIAVRDGHVVLQDPQVARTSVWDTSGTFVRSWHSSCCYWSDIQIDRQNLIYVPSMSAPKDGEPPRGTPYVRWTLEGVARDTVWVPREAEGKYWSVTLKRGGKAVSSMNTSIPLQPALSHTLHPEGGLVYGFTGSYAIVRSATGSDSVRVFGRTWTPDAVTDERRRGEFEAKIAGSKESFGEDNLRSAFKLSDIPSTLPAFENVRVDESGRIWARRYAVTDTTKTTFDVFDSTGAYLGPVTAGMSMSAWGQQAWTREGLVTVIEDQNGRPTVVRLKLTRPAIPK